MPDQISTLLRTTPETIQPSIDQAVEFIQETVQQAGKQRLVVAVSGGIDSAVALTLAVQAVGPEAVTALLLPYGEQDMIDAHLITEFNHLPAQQVQTCSITGMVEAAAIALKLPLIGELAVDHQLRLGNLMARSRMLIIFDWAKALDALVCGTENRSEHYLGYFTRFGDEASDLEPIAGWWKTEVRAAARALALPATFISKAPSAGLWQGQTDEAELGFTYDQADQVLAAWVDWSQSVAAEMAETADVSQIAELAGISEPIATQILDRLTQTRFKRETPYRNER